jgi:hypothetical protein
VTIALEVVGICTCWFVLGYGAEAARELLLPNWNPRPNRYLAAIEVSVLYGPFGIAVAVYEHFEHRLKWWKRSRRKLG